MVEEGRLHEAEAMLSSLYKARVRCYGPQHHDTLNTLGQLAVIQRRVKKSDEAEGSEKKILNVGKDLLKGDTIDRFKSLDFIARFLVHKDDLIEKASFFLGKAYVTYKEKVPEMEITERTRHQIEEIASR